MFEICANAGNRTLFYGLYGSSLIAFEPNPATAALIRGKCIENRLDLVAILQNALSDNASTLELLLSEGCNIRTASLEFAVGTTTITAEVVPSDAAPETKALNRMYFTRIDVEGHAFQISAGLD